METTIMGYMGYTGVVVSRVSFEGDIEDIEGLGL